MIIIHIVFQPQNTARVRVTILAKHVQAFIQEPQECINKSYVIWVYK